MTWNAFRHGGETPRTDQAATDPRLEDAEHPEDETPFAERLKAAVDAA